MLAAILGLLAMVLSVATFVVYCAVKSSQRAETAAKLLRFRTNSVFDDGRPASE